MLWDALFLSACEAWTKQEVTNTTAQEALELGYWFNRGQRISQKPLFEGICAMCGCLLYATLGGRCLGNMSFGPPLSRDGHVLVDSAGKPETQAQPPFLLRFSPALFARECPEMFCHDPATNRLSLQPGKWPPWIRKDTGFKDKTQPWMSLPQLIATIDRRI